MIHNMHNKIISKTNNCCTRVVLHRGQPMSLSLSSAAHTAAKRYLRKRVTATSPATTTRAPRWEMIKLLITKVEAYNGNLSCSRNRYLRILRRNNTTVYVVVIKEAWRISQQPLSSPNNELCRNCHIEPLCTIKCQQKASADMPIISSTLAQISLWKVKLRGICWIIRRTIIKIWRNTVGVEMSNSTLSKAHPISKRMRSLFTIEMRLSLPASRLLEAALFWTKICQSRSIQAEMPKKQDSSSQRIDSDKLWNDQTWTRPAQGSPGFKTITVKCEWDVSSVGKIQSE